MITAAFVISGHTVFRWAEDAETDAPEPWRSRIAAARAALPMGYDPYPEITAMQQVADAHGAQLLIAGEPDPLPDDAVE